MDEKTLHVLEYPKVLERLVSYTNFAVSADLARNLRPSNDLDVVRRRLAETSEAVQLQVHHSDISIGGARDIRANLDLARHGGVLTPSELLDVKFTLASARQLQRTFTRMADAFPHLSAITALMSPPFGLIDAITRAISDHGEVLDSASVRLESIRRDLRVVHERLLSKMQKMVGDPRNAPFLQEALITQRDGRYVLPLRAEFKGRIRSIVHDQSTSGATLFVEPLAVVELNNQYRELQLEERNEERRILAEISLQIGSLAGDIEQTLEIIAHLDLALACGKYADDLLASAPVLHEFRAPDGGKRHPGSVIRLFQARHPLLDPQTVVPIDVDLDPSTYAMIITGPNTGGKTVTLKTIGLLALMVQSGLHIPVQSGSEISVFERIFADIGDEQSIEQSLSTFSGHITNIINILEHASPRSLVILDELGAGTDPQEGAALARAILTHVLERRITTLVTTHHPELKAFAHVTPGAVNASVEFDLETLRPTFHLNIGLPGRSNALAIAQRLGLPEAIIDAARQELSPEDLRAGDLLDEIHHQRDVARQARQAGESARQEAENIRMELSTRLNQIEDERRQLLENAQLKAEDQLRELKDEVLALRRSLSRLKQPTEALQEVEEKMAELEEDVALPLEKSLPAVEMLEQRPLRPGDKVRLRHLGTQGVISALDGDIAEVQVGNLRVRSRLSDLESPAAARLPGAAERTPPAESQVSAAEKRRRSQPSQPSVASAGAQDSPGIELDLRGLWADDALEALDRYLDAAYLSGLPFVRIIHGKGTGKLREVVRQMLTGHPHIKSFEAGGEKEGGDGVTVVKLKN